MLITKKFSSLSSINIELLHSVITLLFYVSATVGEISLRKTEFASETEKLIGRMWRQLHQSMREKIFSGKFGDPVAQKFRKADKDIEVNIRE